MAQANLDAAVFTSVQNIGYFSNFIYCSFGRPYALVVTPEKNVTISPLGVYVLFFIEKNGENRKGVKLLVL